MNKSYVCGCDYVTAQMKRSITVLKSKMWRTAPVVVSTSVLFLMKNRFHPNCWLQ